MAEDSYYLRRREIKRGKAWEGLRQYRVNGKRKQQSKIFPATVKTKADATKALNEWRAEIEAQEGKEPTTTLTLPQYMDAYIEAHSMNIEPSTVKGYTTLANTIKAHFKDKAIVEVTGKDIDAFTAKLYKQGKAPSTIRKTYNYLQQVFKDAMKKGDIETNPFDRATAPKNTYKSDPNPLTDASYSKLVKVLEDIDDNILKCALTLGLRCGLRGGEICALKWSDIDFDKRTLRVQRSIGHGKGEDYTYTKEPKTSTSARIIPFGEDVYSALVELRGAQRADMLLSDMEDSEDYFNSLYALGFIDGRYRDPAIISKRYTELAKMYKLTGTKERRTTFHDLRHTFATVAIASGADVKSVSSILGHANAAMTLNIYADADARAKEQAIRNVEGAYRDKQAD